MIANNSSGFDPMAEFFMNGIFNMVHLHASLQGAMDLGW